MSNLYDYDEKPPGMIFFWVVAALVAIWFYKDWVHPYL